MNFTIPGIPVPKARPRVMRNGWAYNTRSGFKNVKLYDVADMDIVKIQVEALTEKIESDQRFKARPGARCLSCPVAGACDEKPSDLVKIDTREAAEKLAGEVSFMDAQIKQKKKSLKAFCQSSGAVSSGGLVWDNYATESLIVEIAPLLSVCVAHEVDPGDILNTDTTKIKKLFKKNPSFAESLSPYVSVETGTRFSAKKAEEDGD